MGFLRRQSPPNLYTVPAFAKGEGRKRRKPRIAGISKEIRTQYHPNTGPERTVRPTFLVLPLLFCSFSTWCLVIRPGKIWIGRWRDEWPNNWFLFLTSSCVWCNHCNVAYLLKARTVEPEKQPLLGNGYETTFVSRQRPRNIQRNDVRY
jgi:hypothetical protein